MVMRTAFMLAGACTGAAQGGLRALIPRRSSRTQAVCFTSCSPQRAAPELSKLLLSVVVAGDYGSGKSAAIAALARCPLAQQQAQQAAMKHCGLELISTRVLGRPATLAVWCLGGRSDASLGPEFFLLASCFVIVYSPEHGPPEEALEFWNNMCRGNGVSRAPPAVVLACCQAQPEPQQQAGEEEHGVQTSMQTFLKRGQEWCATHGGMPHFVMRSIDDVQAAQQAFAAAATLAVQHASQQTPQGRVAMAGNAKVFI